MIAGLDTATAATAAAVLLDDGRVFEARDDPSPGGRPAHAARLLELLEEVLAQAGGGWGDVQRLAVGVGPGGFTGLRIGVATARALAQAHGLPVTAVSSPAALVAGSGVEGAAGVIDARRGEVFALREPEAPLAAYAPEALAARLPSGTTLVGDGALAHRETFTAAGLAVPDPGDPAHRLSAAWICRLGAAAPLIEARDLLPDYRREPDAVPPSSR